MSTPKILRQTWKYPHKQVAVLFDDNNATIDEIMNKTKCKIYISSADHTEHKMVCISIEGTSDQIFNGHKKINNIRQNGKLRERTSNATPTRTHRVIGINRLENWNLDVSDAKMLSIVHDILDKSHSTNWAILKFVNNSHQIENLKCLSINKYGGGGVQNLAKHLSNIDQKLTYCLLRFDYGFDIERHQIILIIWSPATARNGQKRNIIPILRHKSLIKKVLCVTYEITLSIHSYLNYSYILSELHSKNLVPEILLRVTKRIENDNGMYENDSKESLLKTAKSSPFLPEKPPPTPLFQQKTSPNLEYSCKTCKFFASKQWKLKQLRKELSAKYAMKESDIQITHILYNVTNRRSSKFNSRRETEHVFNTKQDLERTLSELKLYHGSRIYISAVSNSLSNTFLAEQRKAQFTKTKTMSKTKTIKVKLKLSSHIQKLRTLRQMKRKSLIKTESITSKVSLRIAEYDAKSNNNNNGNKGELFGEDEFKSKSSSILINKAESNYNASNESGISRTRSLSTTLTEGLAATMQCIVDKKYFDEYVIGKPEIYEPKPEILDRKWSNKKRFSKALPPSIVEEEKKTESAESTEIECNLDLNEVFIVEKSIGRGKTAHVHYAVYKDECDIALKEFRFGRLTQKILIGFHKELDTLKKLDHDNICRLLGHYVDESSKQLYLAFEWCPCGCLYEIIHDMSIGIEYCDVLEMCLDIAQGMKYLHSMGIVHRDLKSHNLLLTEAYRVKITDFGTAKTLEKIGGTTYTEVGTGGYCAPEVIEPPLQGYDSKIDVFSFGVLCWEIYHRKNIFDQRCLRQINQLRAGTRPTIDDDCPLQFRQLTEKCWEFDPTKRPNFEQIVNILLQIYSEQ